MDCIVLENAWQKAAPSTFVAGAMNSCVNGEDDEWIFDAVIADDFEQELLGETPPISRSSSCMSLQSVASTKRAPSHGTIGALSHNECDNDDFTRFLRSGVGSTTPVSRETMPPQSVVKVACPTLGRASTGSTSMFGASRSHTVVITHRYNVITTVITRSIAPFFRTLIL